MGLLDRFTNLSPDQNQGLLAAASQILQQSGDPRRPFGFGQAVGSGLEAYQGSMQAAQRRKQEEEQLAQMARLRELQMQGLQGDLQDRELARRTPKPIKYGNDVKTATGPDGKPRLYVMGDDGNPKFLDGMSPREKAELVNLGGSEMAINPYEVKPGQTFQRTQTPDSLANNALALRGQDITMRGQNMTDTRARDLNEISQDANAIRRGEKQKEIDMTKASQVASFDTMLGTLGRLGAHPGLPGSVGLRGMIPTVPGSEAANFQAELETFQSQAFIPMVAQLKGMGALSDAEGKKLTAAVGALNPKMGEKAFRDSIGRIVGEMENAKARVSGVPVASKPAAAPTNIPQGAISYLKMNPSLRAEFDAKFGQGAAARVLGR